MGNFISTPETTKETDGGDGNDLTYGMAGMQGWRQDMEDAQTLKVSLSEKLKGWSFFMVFDGHTGSEVATEAGKNLIDSICDQEYFKEHLLVDKGGLVTQNTYDIDKIKNSIIDAFLKFDEVLRDNRHTSGATAVGVLITPVHFFYINCGDSRAIHVRKASEGLQWNGIQKQVHEDYKIPDQSNAQFNKNGFTEDDTSQCILNRSKNFVYFGTKDHKPEDADEKKRIGDAGGSVLMKRVDGSLAVSRALGDFDYKQNEKLEAKAQKVSAEPVITCFPRCKANASIRDAYIVIACDGIFDVISNENLEKYISWKLRNGEPPDRIAKDCCDLALKLGSQDNMTVIIVQIDKGTEGQLDADKAMYDSIALKTKEALKKHEQKCMDNEDPAFKDMAEQHNNVKRLMAYVKSEESPMQRYGASQDISADNAFYHNWVHKNPVPGAHTEGGFIQFRSMVEILFKLYSINGRWE